MNKLRYDELKEGQMYYDVCCGRITEVILHKILNKRLFILHVVGLFPHPLGVNLASMADHGVVGCPFSYGNEFNAMFKTMVDAVAFTTPLEYRIKVTRSEDSWGGEEDFDDYCFNEGKIKEVSDVVHGTVPIPWKG